MEAKRQSESLECSGMSMGKFNSNSAVQVIRALGKRVSLLKRLL